MVVDGQHGPRSHEAPLSDEAQLVVRKALSAVARLQGRCGRQRVADVLHGRRTLVIQRDRLDELSTFGLLSYLPREWIVDLLQRLESAGLIASSLGKSAVLSLLPPGRAVMLDQVRARLALPDLPLTQKEQARFERLRQLRLQWAQQAGLTLFMVISNQTLKDIARACPADRRALAKIAGMGPARMERYGDAILAALATGAVPQTAEAGSLPVDTVLPEHLPLTPAERGRFERLKQLRVEWVQQTGLALFMVLPNQTLKAIARACPVDRKALAEIPGMGPARMERYGEAILEALVGSQCVAAEPGELADAAPAAPVAGGGGHQG